MKIQSVRKVAFTGKLSAMDMDGNYWILNHRFDRMNDAKATATLHKIRAAGEINPIYWRKASRGEKWV